MAPLLAVDVPWLLYRSFFGLPRSIRGKGGMPVGALLGTANAILGLIDACAPRAVVCCLGAEEATYRVALYPPYHAHREPMPDELRVQWQHAGDLLAALGWTVAAEQELEADDLLWSFSQLETAAGGDTLICTADRDLYQAVDEHTSVLDLRSGAAPGRIDVAGVIERSGVRPDQIPDLIALRGDPSDGIPGAKGIGAKTAASLLRVHGTLDGVLAAASSQTPRIALALRAQAEQLRVFRDIAALREIAVTRPPDGGTDRTGGARTARELGMDALARRLEGGAA
jgi:DNA polymerase-1